MSATPARIAGPVALSRRPRVAPPPGAVDAHAHIFGPEARFPFAEGRGYTPPDAPVEAYLALLDRLGLARGVLVQGNAHGFDNAVLLDALERAPDRLRAIAITDGRLAPEALRDWHRLGVRGLRFHEHAPDARPGYVQGVGLEVLARFRPVMRELGWVVQVFCHHRRLPAIAAELAAIAREMPVVLDHMLMVPAARGIADPGFQALLRLVGEGAAHVKLSAPYRLSAGFPDHADARPFHAALLAANPDRLLWGTDWPHTSIPAATMPDDGGLLDLFTDWTPRAEDRARILVETPARLFW
ncbi:amidohydrolase family protein [Falsiroseomonas sp. E2-1-a20]|uniref:amidohydrolase family protein n=1 Tax=Falsiroseomonas sp. E2-1-a20 TaxID=3239300 RepID=UPI003F39684E